MLLLIEILLINIIQSTKFYCAISGWSNKMAKKVSNLHKKSIVLFLNQVFLFKYNVASNYE